MQVEANKELLKSNLLEIIKKLKHRKDVDRGKTNFVVTYGAVISA